jgi:hypothetical protein
MIRKRRGNTKLDTIANTSRRVVTKDNIEAMETIKPRGLYITTVRLGESGSGGDTSPLLVAIDNIGKILHTKWLDARISKEIFANRVRLEVDKTVASGILPKPRFPG